jgi:hypothetical protein
MFLRNRLVLLATLAVFAILAFSPSITSAVECQKESSPCISTTTVIEVWPPNPPFCLRDHPIVEVTSSATCKGGNNAGPTVAVRCGALNIPVVYSGSGYEHTLQVNKEGEGWEAVLWHGCDYLEYTATSL